MLKFEQLQICNFGPFKGNQVIDFGKKNGVTIIWGDNGRGKTTLLNIFRYALYGHIKDRRGSSADYLSLSNIEAKENGNYGFSVVLKMSNDSDSYILTRDVHLRDGIHIPKSNEDFIEDCFLKKNGNILAVPDRDHELSLIMPIDISRFFLFDGELLQEYETLLDDTSNDGELIKTSIEKILGMPILTNGAKDIADLISEYITAKNKAAQNDQNTAEYAHAIAVLIDQIAGHESECKRLEGLLEYEIEQFDVIKKKMSDTEKLRGWLANEAKEIGLCESLKKQREGIQADIQVKMKSAWQGMVQPVVSSLIEDIKAELEHYNKKNSAARASQSVLHEIEKTIQNHECGICGQQVPDALVASLQIKLEEIKTATPLFTLEERNSLHSLQIRLNSLQVLKLQGEGVLIRSKLNDLNRVGIELSDAEQQLRDIRKQIKTFGDFDSATVTLANDYSLCQTKIAELKKGITDEKKAITDAIDKRDKLDAKVSQMSKNKDVITATIKLTQCQKIENIFSLGVDQYRTRLKERVEADASGLFTQMSADQDYERLRINDNYGLEIIHKTGITVPSRSAGFEHVVALSLIGALHKNAPLRGPVIMDSPFGRLSEQHEKNVSKNLSHLSSQVILLVHDRELEPLQTRELLGGNLLKEYRLERVTSFHTKIC